MLQDEARRPLGGLLITLALAAGLALGAPAAADPCEAAAAGAAQAHGVPLPVMRAVLRVETGEGRGEARRGWPWSANADGRSLRFDTRGEAMAFASGPAARAAGNVDLGCFQISERWHGHAFSGPREMLDPQRNAAYAARLLRGHFERLGDWTLAAGAYHSMTEAVAVRYRARFARELAALAPAAPAPVPPQVRTARRPGPARPLLEGHRPGPMVVRVASRPVGVRPVAPLPTHGTLEPVPPLVPPRPADGARPGAGSLVPSTGGAGPLLRGGWGG